jgi:hypothetical protein
MPELVSAVAMPEPSLVLNPLAMKEFDTWFNPIEPRFKPLWDMFQLFPKGTFEIRSGLKCNACKAMLSR